MHFSASHPTNVHEKCQIKLSNNDVDNNNMDMYAVNNTCQPTAASPDQLSTDEKSPFSNAVQI